ncbi:junction-mediating and -regulatory protein [Syngnathoides biaculeatus]|uniref:junction-mediating and -regulatory protein n=1 Tax=Syngnathoides biaculeatus TaxID=300417 RepID=UPI002ADD9EBB|nr:junction-mediating and -regulatory protein [Syngnathoides biaculeatus]
MSFAMEDNLESGWVSVRPKAFDEKERHKFAFIVAWNDIEGKFAITCHNRTVQRRTTFLDPLLDWSPAADDGLPGVASKQDGGRPAKVRPKEKVDSWDPEEPEEAPLSPAEDSEAGGRQDFSWAGLFSFHELRAAHLQLCAVNADLEPCLPAFPEEPSGVWSVLFGGSAALSEGETEALCYQLQVYLGHALDTCGWKIFSQVLFTDSDDTDEYYESLSELRRNGYEDGLDRAKRRLQEVLDKHRGLDSMVDLLRVYGEEDEAYGHVLEAATQLYHYLLQPFRDMRELATLRRQQIKISLETERLGPRRVDGLKREDEEWQKKAHAAVLAIQDLTVKFFETTNRGQKALYERMRADQRRLGKSAWAAAVERMERLQYSVSKETLQLMRAKEICLEQRKHGLKEEMRSLQGGEDAMLHLDQLEALYYELQLQLYDIQAEVLRCEELLLTAQLQSLRRQITERQDEVVYYDAFESPDAMEGPEDPAGPPPLPPLRGEEELGVLRQRTRQLEARRGRINTKKVYLKNKKEICISNHKQKIGERQGVLASSLQVRETEEEEAERNARVSLERQRTLDRLRSLNQRYPGHVTLKSSRLRLLQTRRRAGQTPCTQAAGVQTDCVISDLPKLSVPPPGDAYESLPAAHPENLDSPSPFLSLPTSVLTLQGTPQLPPPPPPPLPPPPPPPPASIEPCLELRCDPEPASLPLSPVSPRFFDSSQLLTARKKLRKTSAEDATQWRRASSPMDEVLASLKRGSFHLRKAELRVLGPDPDDDGENILAQIRQGVRLRQVRAPPERPRRAERFAHSADALTRSIHEALRRIKEASPESESEDEGLPCADWEN